MTDDEIIKLFFERDEQAIEQVKSKYGRYMLCISKNILSSPEDAEECENDALLAAWNTIPPQKPSCLKSYLAALTRHISFDKCDREQAKKRGSKEYTLACEELSEVLPDGESDPLDRIAMKEALNGFLARLSEQERIIFVMRYWYLLSLSEIARKRGMKESAVKMQLFRTRKKLAQHLSHYGINNP